MISGPTSPAVHKRLPGFLRFHSSLLTWLGIGWFGFLVLPWYAAYDGFWSFIWITDGYPMFDEYSPGLLQIFTHARWWLLPTLGFLLLPIVAIFLKKTDPRYPLILLFAGGLGLT